MVTNVVNKSLAGAEDILRGVDTVTQIRNGNAYEMHQVHAPVAVSSEANLTNLNPAVATTAAIVAADSVTYYNYSPTDTSGLTSLFGGSWLIYNIINSEYTNWRDIGDIRGWGAKSGGADCSLAIQAAIDSGAKSIVIPDGEWYVNTAAIQLPARDITIKGAGRNSILRGAAPTLLAYPLSDLGFQNVYGIKFVLNAGQTGIQMHKVWTAAGKEEVQVTNCHFYSTAVGVTFISVKGIWSGRIQDNEFFGGSRANDSYGILFITDDNMNSSIMNLEITDNKMTLVTYPVYYAGKTLSSGGRLEGIAINNNKTIASKIGVRLSATLATTINDNMIHDCDISAIELYGDFDFVINGNVELVGAVQSILLTSPTDSILERGVISGNKISAGNGRIGVNIKNGGTAPRTLSISGNVIGRVANGAQTGVGVKIDSAANVNSVAICGNAFQYLDTAVDRGGNTGSIIVDGNAYILVTNIGAGSQSTPFAKSVTVTLVGGATTEVVTIDVPTNACANRPQFASAMGTGVSANSRIIGYYDFDASTATQLKFNIMRSDGTAFTAGSTVRLNILANMV